MELKKICSKCKLPQLITDFHKQGPERRRAKCKYCCSKDYKILFAKQGDKERARSRKNAKIARQFNPLRIILKEAKYRASKKNMAFDLDKAYLEDLYAKTNGCCELTGLPFDLMIDSEFNCSPYRPSLDRINNKIGYIRGNVRFVLWMVNQAIGEFGEGKFIRMARAAVQKEEQAKQSALAQAFAEYNI